MRLEVLDSDKCVGCQCCMFACTRIHKDVGLAKSCIGVKSAGGMQHGFMQTTCRACVDPPCARACPEDALLPRKGGGVILKTERCTGCGTCVKACPFGAITVVKGVAIVDNDKCTSCELCVASCPKALIAMIPLREHTYQVKCRNTTSGADTRKVCIVGCIGCQRCVKACGDDAIHMQGPLAIIDQDKCTACGKCEAVCPTNTIHHFHPGVAEPAEVAATAQIVS